MRRLRSGVLNELRNEINDEDFCYAINDTSNIKSGKKIFGIGKWGANNKKIYTGQKIFVLSLLNKRKGYELPLHYFIYEKVEGKVLHSGYALAIKLLKTDHQRRARKTKYIKESIVYIKERKSALKEIAVYNKLTESSHFSIYITNNLKISGAFLYELGRKRWIIEELFRNLKQKLSFSKLLCTGKVAADLSICLSFSLIISLHLSPNELH